MKNLLFLFSAGQDSILYFYFFLCQKKQEKLSLVTVNHSDQVNSFLLIFHIIRSALTFQQSFFISSVEPVLNFNDFVNEKRFRFSRYSLVKRLNYFYKYELVVTAQTYSDLIETFFIKLFQRKKKFKKFDFIFIINQFQQKKLLKKLYFLIKSTRVRTKVQKNKKKVATSFRFFLRKTNITNLQRPFQQIERIESANVLKNQNFPVFIELTNFDSFIFRNKLRLYFLPLVLNTKNFKK